MKYLVILAVITTACIQLVLSIMHLGPLLAGALAIPPLALLWSLFLGLCLLGGATWQFLSVAPSSVQNLYNTSGEWITVHQGELPLGSHYLWSAFAGLGCLLSLPWPSSLWHAALIVALLLAAFHHGLAAAILFGMARDDAPAAKDKPAVQG